MSTDRRDSNAIVVPAHPDGGALVILCPPTIDGGVRLHWRVPDLVATAELHELLARAGPHGSLERLPMPAQHSERWADCRRLASGRVELDVCGEATITLDLAGRTVELRLGAPVLWRDGFAAVAGRWIAVLGAWLVGGPIGLADARGEGWQTITVPLAVDVHGLTWSIGDAYNFTGRSLCSTVGYDRNQATLRIGGKKARARFVIYDKTRELAARRHRDRMTYQPLWSRAEQHDPERDVQRVELRLQGDALDLVDADTGEVIDLRDPFALTRADTLAAVWAYQTHSRRWIIPNVATRNRRAATDPRWAAIQRAVSCPPLRLRQARESRRRTFARMRDRLLVGFGREFDQLASLYGIVVEPGGLESWLRMVELVLAVDSDAARFQPTTDAGFRRRHAHLCGEVDPAIQARIRDLVDGQDFPGLRLLAGPPHEPASAGARPVWPRPAVPTSEDPARGLALPDSDNDSDKDT